VRPFSKRDLVRSLTEAQIGELGGSQVVHVSDKDGVKFLLADNSWLLIRPSGTEPVLRVYAEARSPEQVKALLQAGIALAENHLPRE